MAWRVLFIRDCDIHVSRQRTIAYRVGHVALLTDPQAAEALVRDAVELIADRTPGKPFIVVDDRWSRRNYAAA
jgi:hypothetical protein